MNRSSRRSCCSKKIIAEADKRLADVERYSGIEVAGETVLDYPWKTDDRIWFEENPKRSHRARMPFAGEDCLSDAKVLPGCAPIVLVRQIKPGTRMRRGFDLNTALLPVPDFGRLLILQSYSSNFHEEEREN
jgi:hypothetical protein